MKGENSMIIMMLAHLVPLIYYGAQILINERLRNHKHWSIDSVEGASILSVLALGQGVLKILGAVQLWVPIWLPFWATIVMTIITVGIVVMSGMTLLSYRKAHAIQAPIPTSERAEMVFLCAGGIVTLLVYAVDFVV